MSVEKLPLAVEIEINSHCNMACSYCPNARAERVESGHMAKETFVTLMEQLRSENYKGRISFHFYNEPTLSPQLPEFIRITRSYLSDSFIDIFSNGTLLTLEKIKDFFDMGVSKFNITEHVRSDLQLLKDEIKNCSDDKITSKIHLKSYRTIDLTNRGGALKIKKKSSPNLVPPLSLPCLIPYCALVVTVKGNVVCCYEDYFQKHVMGNIHEQNIVDIWNSEKYQSMRQSLKKGQRHLFPVCQDCNNTWIIS